MNLNILRNMIFDEYSSLLYLDKLVNQTNREISLRIEKFSMFNIGEFEQLEHLPLFDRNSDKFNILEWRKKQKLPDITKYLSKSYVNLVKDTCKKTLKMELLDYYEFISLLDNLDYWKKIKRHVSIWYVNSSIDTSCVELPIQQQSIILCSLEDSEEERILYLLHEIGHAMVNYYKHKNGWLFPLEADELFAHLFEFVIIRDLIHLMENSKRDIFKCNYFEYNLDRFRNSIIYSCTLIDFFSNDLSECMYTKELLDIMNRNALEMGVEEKTFCENLNRSNFEELFEYLCYSTMYLFPHHIIRCLEKNEDVNIQINDILLGMEAYAKGKLLSECLNHILINLDD